ncbi:LacI family DNA-binding transcriptional regulator [Maliponia aquimaris]|uniref:Ribose operon repressor n=1 Tax=Maliponia aquimaris TaxID=1673631 RepID=A0A238K9M3_9RHOB|nr:LacI family DNA-binding transcriptional regulator [Maliponia aquimaris]SMX38792.1 Ribose operon repressor [Maliponia aquimaris]
MSGRKIRNMEEFAEVSGISRPTVSKYFHDPDSVRKSTRARIERALEEYDYRPNIFAINQNRKLTKNIGIVVPYLADPVFAEFARKLEMLVNAAGFRPILLSSHGDSAQEVENLESLRAIKPAGALLAPLGRTSDRSAVESFCDAVPSVLFDSNIKGLGNGFIGHNNSQATSLICEYLCRTGQPPAFFEMRTPSNPNAYRRRQTYCEVMEGLGHEPMLLQVEGDGWEFERIGMEQGIKLIEAHGLPTDTVLCSNDRLAIGLLAAAFHKGLRVGRGPGTALRIAGHDDHPFSRYTCPPLTTVSHDYSAIAERSVELLFSLIESGLGAAERVEVFFDGKLLMRQSA